jgi:PRTRC genetic system ThiF family protein
MRANSDKSLPKPEIHALSGEVSSGPNAAVRIALAGAGGNGSQMVTCLARMDRALRCLDLGRIDLDLYDPDLVTQSNIGRQLFYPSEVGLNKASALVHRANVGFGVQWQAITEKYLAQSCKSGLGHFALSSRYDFLITCVDSGAARREISDAMQPASPDGKSTDSLARGVVMPPVYWLDLGNEGIPGAEGSTGQVILGQPAYWLNDTNKNDTNKNSGQRLPTVVELYPEFYDGQVPESNLPSCSLADALVHQDLFINDHVSRWAAHLLWTLLRTRQLAHAGYFVNLRDGRVNPLPARHWTARQAPFDAEEDRMAKNGSAGDLEPGNRALVPA